MFLKKGVLECCPISTLHFLVLPVKDFVIKMDLQIIRKKLWSRVEKICKKESEKEGNTTTKI